MNKPTWILLHCTDVSYRTQSNQFESVNAYHKSLWDFKSRLGYYGGYHKIVTGGKIYTYRADDEIGAHCNNVVDEISINEQSLALCWGGDGDIEYPLPEDYTLIKRQIQEWQNTYNIPNDRVVYHRRFNVGKTCPGGLLGDEWLANLLEREPVEKPLDQKVKQVSIEQKKTLMIQVITLMKKVIELLTGKK